MLKFPHLASGDRITRAWFNRLIDYCNSLSLSGDGRTTRVSHGSAGTVVSAIPQAAEAGGGGGSSGWNFVVSRKNNSTVSISAGSYWVDGIATRNAEDVSVPNVSGNYYLCLVYDEDYITPGSPYKPTYHVHHLWLSNPSLENVVGFPLALVPLTNGAISGEILSLAAYDLPRVSLRRHPFELYYRGFTEGGTSLSCSSVIMAPGYLPARLGQSQHERNWQDLSYDGSAFALYAKIRRSLVDFTFEKYTGSLSNWSSSLYDTSDNTSYYLIGYVPGGYGKIQQIAASAPFAIDPTLS